MTSEFSAAVCRLKKIVCNITMTQSFLLYDHGGIKLIFMVYFVFLHVLIKFPVDSWILEIFFFKSPGEQHVL